MLLLFTYGINRFLHDAAHISVSVIHAKRTKASKYFYLLHFLTDEFVSSLRFIG